MEKRDFMQMILTDSFPSDSVKMIGSPANPVWELPSPPLQDSGVRPVIITDIPGYLEISPREGLGCARAGKYPGFRIVLSGFSSGDDYLRSHLSKSQQYSINRARKRLEEVFEVNYTTYWGSMDTAEYHQLFDTLIALIRERASERQTADDDWAYLDFYRDSFLDLIRKKKANCQVIRANDEIVAIGFNLCAGKGIYGFIKSYNTDFSKFYPGLLSVIQLVDWCLQEGFGFLDMLKHDNPYKLEFANDVYRYQTHFLYREDSIGQKLACRFATYRINLFYKILDWGKKKNLHIAYRRLRGRNGNNEGLKQQKPETTVEALPEPEKVSVEGLRSIDLDSAEYRHLKRAVYTFLFTAREPLNEIGFYLPGNEPGALLVKGKRTAAILHQKADSQLV